MPNLFKILLPLLMLCHSLLAFSSIDIDTIYYSVYGTTAHALRQDMNAKNPINESGNKHDAYTSWTVKWHFNWYIQDKQCHIKNVTTQVDVALTLPKWESRSHSNTILIHQWDRYYQALTTHENGHKEFGINAAAEIKNKLSFLSSRTCQTLEKEANTLGREIINKYIDIEKEYDRKTNHGINNGAAFP